MKKIFLVSLLASIIFLIVISGFIFYFLHGKEFTKESDFKCVGKISSGKDPEICGYIISNIEAIPKNISYEYPNMASDSINTFQVTGKVWEKQYPSEYPHESISQKGGSLIKYIEIKSITLA